ncbi:MAG TPA: NnrU family protein [Kaistiaceae bacterium]|nr:NnrU family protein [Kaistiaceae bacterium]
MTVLIIGLILFLGVHMVPAFPDLRRALHDRLGEGAYKGLFSLASLVGLAVLIWGYGLARAAGPAILWEPPAFLRHIEHLLMLIAFIVLTAAYVPGRIKAKLRHPMLVAVKTWAFAHLLVNGDAASILLFGAFLAWAVFDRISVARRERAGLLPAQLPVGPVKNDIIAVAVGTLVFLAFFFKLHIWLIGVPVY